MDKEQIIYVHYGNNKFDKDAFVPVKNRDFATKPFGGFWASRTDASFGWKDWCEAEQFRECNENNKIEFSLSSNARIFQIKTMEDVKKLKESYGIVPEHLGFIPPSIRNTLTTIDFEKMAEKYDGIEYFHGDPNVRYELYTWDCDSIVIFNPDVIIPQKAINKETVSIADDILNGDEKYKDFTSEEHEEPLIK